MDFRSIPLHELARQVRSRQVAAREVTEFALRRIEALNPRLNAFVDWDGDAAEACASDIDERLAHGEDVGPLAGIPIGVKDVEHAAGFRTTFGSVLHRSDAPQTVDSHQVARLRAAGCVVVGKTNTSEYGSRGHTDNPLFGTTANPWSVTHSPGGSSGGTASAIAGGLVPLGTGSDGGGSIRVPSSFCGISGLKSTQGRIALPGPAAPGSGLVAVAGPMANTSRDIAYALDVVAGSHELDLFSLPDPEDRFADCVNGDVRPPRMLWVSALIAGPVDDQVSAACANVLATAEATGVDVDVTESVWEQGEGIMEWLRLWVASRFRLLGHLEGTPEWELIDAPLREQITMGKDVTATQYADAIDSAYALNAKLSAALARAPIVITPTSAGLVPLGGENGTINGVAMLDFVRFTWPLNMTRNPAGTVCVGRDSQGLPIGMQVIGRRGDEAGVLKAMAFIEGLVSVGYPPDVQ